MQTQHHLFEQKFARLRMEAEILLKRSPELGTKTGHSILELVQELNIHQAELLIQNEELKEAQNKITRISREYESLYELAPCGYVTLTNKGIISRINKSALDLLGEKNLRVNYTGFSLLVENGWQDLYHAALENSARSGIKQCLDLKLKNDSKGPLWIQTEIDALRDDNGQVLEWRMVFTDISQRIVVEDALQESQERFKTLFHNTPLACQSLDENGNLIETNDAWLRALGYQKQEVTGHHFSEFLTPSMKDHFKENFPRFKAVGEILGVEFEMVKKDGTPILVSFHGKIGKTSSGEFKQTHCVFSDITEQRKARKKANELQQRLQQARKLEAIGVLAGGIAHDFNNILYPIIGFSELTLQDLPVASPLRENVDMVLQGAKRAADLVRQILSFTSQKQKKAEPLLVQDIVNESLRFLRSTIPSNIKIIKRIDSLPIYILGDPIQVYEVIMNLCTNAYQAMEKQGGILSVCVNEIEITQDQNGSGMKPGSYCKIRVQDSGPGIPKEDLNKIYDPYFTTKAFGEGSGLGLSVVHGIMKKHNGFIKAKSKPGETIFDIYFPRTDKKEVHEKGDECVSEICNERILFVDDEESIVTLVSRGLKMLGYKIQGRTSSAEAIEEFEKAPEKFDLVITDMTMPYLTGTQLIEKIRQIRPEIPVILCSGYSKQINDEAIKKYKINGFMQKPILIKDLSKKIREIFNRKEA